MGQTQEDREPALQFEHLQAFHLPRTSPTFARLTVVILSIMAELGDAMPVDASATRGKGMSGAACRRDEVTTSGRRKHPKHPSVR